MSLYRLIKKWTFLSVVLIMVFTNINVGQAKTVSKESAKSAILIDLSTGRPLYEKNAHEKLKIASITKVLTAVLAIESGRMNQTVKISRNAARMEGSSVYLQEGETIPLKDIVMGLMLRSGNDAATAIAEAVGGSVKGFVQLMNEKAKELGMTDTHFANPHGLDDPLHYSTAYDMALLTRYAMTLPAFRKITSTTSYHSKGDGDSIDRYWKNKNKLLFSYPYITGGKTGYTTGARRTLITTASKDGRRFAVVTLNDGNDWRDHRHLYEWAFQTFQMTTLIKTGKLATGAIPGLKEPVYSHKTIRVPLSAKEVKQLKATIFIKSVTLTDRLYKNKIAGNLTFSLNNSTLCQIPLYYHQSSAKPSSFWELIKATINRLTNFGAPND